MEVWLGRTWPSSSISNSSLHPLKACAVTQTGCTSGAPRHRICRESSKIDALKANGVLNQKNNLAVSNNG